MQARNGLFSRFIGKELVPISALLYVPLIQMTSTAQKA